MMQTLEQKLIEFGFSEKEASVYLAMLELGPSSVQDIAKKAGVNRATTYVMIESLKRRGLMSSVERGKKILFAAESPEHLLGIIGEELRTIEDKKQRLEGLMPQFLALFNAVEDKPRIRYFEGEEGVSACREAMMELVRGTQLGRAFIHYDSAMIAFAKHNERQRIRLASHPAKARLLFSKEEGVALPEFGRNIEMRRVPDSIPAFHGECDIYDHIVLIATVRTRPIAVLIESRDIAQSLQSFFDLAWMAAEEVRTPNS